MAVNRDVLDPNDPLAHPIGEAPETDAVDAIDVVVIEDDSDNPKHHQAT